MDSFMDVTEQKRLNEAREAHIPWKKWGTYLSERQWGTVRKTTATTAMRRTISPMTRHAHAPTAGARMGSGASAMTSNSSALRWRCGTSGTRS